MSRVMAIDYGKKRIGLALSDPLGIIAQPYKTLQIEEHGDPIKEIAAIIKEKSVSIIVLGNPIRHNGESGTLALEIRRLAEKLESDAKVQVVLWDEAFTTHQAKETLREAKRHTRSSEGLLDKLAAQIILQEYLEQ